MSTRRQSCAFHGQLMRLNNKKIKNLNTFFNAAEFFFIQSIINYLGEFFLHRTENVRFQVLTLYFDCF